MKYAAIEYESVEKGIGILALNRPRKFNMVNQEMMMELEDFWGERLDDLETRVIILKAKGKRNFCAGLDIRESMKTLADMNTEQFYRFQVRLGRLNLAMRKVPQPIICAVHGAAVGIGFSFALASDIRIVSEDAKFSAAFINIGLGGADMACSYFLPRLMGSGRAYELMLTGNFLHAQEALGLGLISQVVPGEQLEERAFELAQTLNSKNPMGLRLTKEAINMNIDAGSLEQALRMEDRNQALLWARGKAGEGKKTSRYF